ncbi:MAG TPA: alanine racemase [Candidatus Avidesulfovibrio excrementigallinarum]|nr:alanine racemase [Candidatus Avidesulfovibrio excrementigallinarum]
MPELVINLDALEHNLRLIRQLEQRWRFTLLPVLKMVSSHPSVVSFLQERGIAQYGVADVWDHLAYSPMTPARNQRVLINLSPQEQADDVVRLFARSAISNVTGFRALDAAARRQGIHHETVLMVDLGDMREGVPLQNALPLLHTVAAASCRAMDGCGAHVAGLGVNLGCLYGTCPDDENMIQLSQLAARAGRALGHPLQRVSLGGTVFWNWIAAQEGRLPRLPEHCLLELRMGDPLLLGYDMYRNEPLKGGPFRTDLFRLSTTVLEVTERDIKMPRHHVHNGQGLSPHCALTGRRRRALTDCGSLHTDVSALRLDLPGARIVDYSGNYAILDVTDCPQAPEPGDRVDFIPGYWAVARAARTPQVVKTILCHQPPSPARHPDAFATTSLTDAPCAAAGPEVS